VLWASADKLRGNVDAAEYKHLSTFPIDAKDRPPAPLVWLPETLENRYYARQFGTILMRGQEEFAATE
jgi:hypothetical protein